jgi:hypothetical protein
MLNHAKSVNDKDVIEKLERYDPYDFMLRVCFIRQGDICFAKK